MPKPGHQSRERRVRLKQQYAHLYPGISPTEWWPAWLIAEKLLALAETQGVSPQERIFNPSHFDFRGGSSRGPRLQDLRTRRSDKAP
jgi:hypothetical protein